MTPFLQLIYIKVKKTQFLNPQAIDQKWVVNKTRNGTEWNGMEKVNKTRNGTAESAQSTPTHPWLTELHPRKLFVHADGFAHSFSWKRMGNRLLHIN